MEKHLRMKINTGSRVEIRECFWFPHGYSRGRRFFVSPPICQSLAADAFERIGCAFCIFNTARGTVVIAEIEFRQIAVQMITAAMLVRAIHAALEHTKKVLNRVGVPLAAYVLMLRMVYGLMVSKLFRYLAIQTRVIGHQHRIRRDILLECRLDAVEHRPSYVHGTCAPV